MSTSAISANFVKKSIPLCSANSSRRNLHSCLSHSYEAISISLRDICHHDNLNHISSLSPNHLLAYDPPSKSPPEFPSPPSQEPYFPKEMPEIHTSPEFDPIPLENPADPPPMTPGPNPGPEFPGPPIPMPPVPDIPMPPPDILPHLPPDSLPPRPPDIFPPPTLPPDIEPPTGPGPFGPIWTRW